MNASQPFNRDDRIAQLTELESLCSRIAEQFIQNGERYLADAFAAKGRHAAELIAHGFSQADLNELGGQFPSAMWLNPKALDYGVRRLPWQDEVAELHDRAVDVVWTLRTIALD